MKPAFSAGTVEPAGPQHKKALALLFQRCEAPCFCQYWQFGGDKNAWQMRCAENPERNRSALTASLDPASASNHTAPGLVALERFGQDDAHALGWLRLGRAENFDKLYGQRLYRRLPCFDGDRRDTFTVGCFLVDPQHRRRGVARALLAHAIQWVRDQGGRRLEAFPRRAEGVDASQLLLGPLALYFELGFETVHDFHPYPVLRLPL